MAGKLDPQVIDRVGESNGEARKGNTGNWKNRASVKIVKLLIRNT